MPMQSDQPGLWGRIVDIGQRIVPGGRTGYAGPRTNTDRVGSYAGAASGVPFMNAILGELGQNAGDTRFGQRANAFHPIQAINNWASGLFGGNSGQYTGPQLGPLVQRPGMWDVNLGGYNSPGYQGFGSGTGAFPYQGGNSSQPSGEDIYNQAISGSNYSGVAAGSSPQVANSPMWGVSNSRGPSFGYSGDTASGARGTIGMGVRQASLSGIESMLGAGLGHRGGGFGRQGMPFHEINNDRAEARSQGMSLGEYIDSGQSSSKRVGNSRPQGTSIRDFINS